MAAVKEALQLATEVSCMIDCMITEKLGCSETVNDFLDWAIEEHAAYACDQIGIDRKGIDDLLKWADDASADEDSFDIALPLFRYYLQAAKARFDYTDNQLADLSIIDKPRIKIANLNDLMAKVTPAPAIHKAAHRVSCPECNNPAYSNESFDA